MVGVIVHIVNFIFLKCYITNHHYPTDSHIYCHTEDARIWKKIKSRSTASAILAANAPLVLEKQTMTYFYTGELRNTHKQTDGQTDGHYQFHDLPASLSFTVDNECKAVRN